MDLSIQLSQAWEAAASSHLLKTCSYGDTQEGELCLICH